MGTLCMNGSLNVARKYGGLICLRPGPLRCQSGQPVWIGDRHFSGCDRSDGRDRHIAWDGDFTIEGLEGDAVAAHDVSRGAGLELAGGVAELVEDFLDELGGAGAGGADLLDEGLEVAVCGEIVAALCGIALGGGECAGEEVDLAGIRMWRADAWHDDEEG